MKSQDKSRRGMAQWNLQKTVRNAVTKAQETVSVLEVGSVI